MDKRQTNGEPRRGRPRSEAVERQILEAVIKLLEEGVSLADLSIERIARTAGVGKATIYRRWAGKEELFVEVVQSMESPTPPLPGQSLRGDLIAMVENVRQRGAAKRSSALLHNVFAQMQSYPKLWCKYHSTVIDPRRELFDEVLRRGMATGELRAGLDLDMAGDLFVAPMLVRTMMRPDTELPGPEFAERIVDAVLEGLRPPR
ncbi:MULTISPECIES: TetR/AcrR family transcriptional regulator [Streptomyces]|uniref:TetR/AcrR family transcriptional regulator n=1 Tax=Streptomyces TaxID=1883 RepID=UPI000C273D78|nr:TetR/AcrR family transcriptional regulator [Streptomyces sp. CB01201]MBX7465258.1 TetR/AcrR family transcriptional regulator [Streptomyces sp. MAG02]PJN01312.1 TetR family transcriptional regulator [Streptomyces sp. CB01201]